MRKINFLDITYVVSISLILILTYKYNWWSNGNLKIQDYIFLPILLIVSYFFRHQYFVFLILLFFGLTININNFSPLFSVFLITFALLT